MAATQIAGSIGRDYVKRFGRYRTSSWRQLARHYRDGIPPEVYEFAERRMRGEIRRMDPHEIFQSWSDPSHEILGRQYRNHTRGMYVRSGGSPFFRSIVWPQQEEHDRAVHVPAPSRTSKRYSWRKWTDERKVEFFWHCFMESKSIARFAQIFLEYVCLCIEHYREMFHLPLSREDRLRTDWTADEDRELLAWVDNFGERDWIRISHFLRHHQETCKFRYRELKGRDFNTEIEDYDESTERWPLHRPVDWYPEDYFEEQSEVGDESNDAQTGATSVDPDARRENALPADYEAPINKKRSIDEDHYDDSSSDGTRSKIGSSVAKRARSK